MDQQKITKIAAIIIGVVIAIVLIIVAFRFVSGRFGQAAGQQATDTQVTDITDNSAIVSFNTATSTQCFVQYGLSPEESGQTFFAQDAAEATTHDIELSLLAEETTYHFMTVCGNTKTLNNGVAFQFTTAAKGTGDTTTATARLTPTVTLLAPTRIPSPTIIPTVASSTPGYCASIASIRQQKSADKNWTTVDCARDCVNARDCAEAFREE